jgi:hypothetical protein
MSAVTLPRRILGRASRIWRQTNDHLVARLLPTYAVADNPPQENARFGFLGPAFVQQLAEISPWHPGLIGHLAEMALEHRFELLGSGPVTVFRGMQCRGLEGIVFDPALGPSPDSDGQWLSEVVNRSNVAEARRTWRCIRGDYRPIDWQIDFKSGYRWSEGTWHANIRFGDIRGADVKVPWELARMQHLPVLALAAHYAAAGRLSDRPEVFVSEARNQMLDFIATNPPGFGVNWACAMDVAIRAANMIIAHDMLAAASGDVDPEFEAIFAGSVLAHARHIAKNLEWSPVFRGNHYLANLAGLLFAAAHLPGGAETDDWLAFATRELFVEIDYQFHPDGSNFEGSTCYHRLSAEIVLWSLALLDNLPPDRVTSLAESRHWRGAVPPVRALPELPLHVAPSTGRATPVPPEFRQRLHAMAGFTRALTRPDGTVVQFGDNDSGRFLLLGAEDQRGSRAKVDAASSLDHRALTQGVAAFLGAPASDAASLLLAGFAGRQPDSNCLSRQAAESASVGDATVWKDVLALADAAQDGAVWRTELTVAPGLLHNLEWHGFAGMGCYVFQSSRLFLAIRCGEIGVRGLGAHDHCDQLGVELVMEGRNVVRDPGSFVYTANPDLRNSYRSVKAHHAPRHGDSEPANLKRGVFDLRDAAPGQCLYFGSHGFAGRHRGYGFDVYRLIELLDDRIIIRDISPDGHAMSDPMPDPIDFSPGYGLIENKSLR